MKNTVQKRGKHDKHNGLKTQPTNNMKTNWNMPLFSITPSALSIIMQHMHACSLVPAFFHPGRLGSQIFPLLPTCVRGSKADLDLWACRICCTCLVGRAGLVSVAMVSVSRPDNAGVMDHRGAYSPRVLIFWPLGSQLDNTDHRKTLFFISGSLLYIPQPWTSNKSICLTIYIHQALQGFWGSHGAYLLLNWGHVYLHIELCIYNSEI